MLDQYKPWMETKLQSLVKHLKWINPNALTLIGIIPQVLFFILMRHHLFGWAALALAFSVVDMLDGMVARAAGKITAFGAFLDSTIDRVSDFLIIAAFYAAGLINLSVATWLLVVTYLISYTRSRAELASMGRIKFNHGIIERPERIIFLFVVLVLQIVFPAKHLTQPLILVLLILSIYTLAQRIFYAYKKL